MRNEDTPAYPGQQGSGFTKREAVMLEFAKELIGHYSREHECLSKHYDEIMREARTLADWYFEIVEE